MMTPEQIAELDSRLRLGFHQTMHVIVRGMFACFPHAAVEKVLLLFVMVAAQVVSELYAGDQLAVYKFRKSCLDIFDETTKKMPVVPLVQPETKTNTAAIASNG